MAPIIFLYMDKLVYICALASLFQSRPAVCKKLLDEFDNPSRLFNLKEDQLLDLLGNNQNLVRQMLNPDLLEKCYKEIEWAQSKGVSVLTVQNPAFPPLLNECEDAPVVLYYIGMANLIKQHSVSIVGTRLASSYGREMCKGIVSALSEYNPLIISGLAYGIDACAHKAALDAGINTIGVLPCGMDTIYPSTHRNMAEQMVKQGGILTEFPRGMPVRKWHFIKRNRIIAGMSRSVIVVETRIRGGAMSTVEFANSYNRDVYAVPGRVCDTNSYGCNYLISKNMAQIYTHDAIGQISGQERYAMRVSASQPGLFSFDNEKKEKILLSLKNNSARDLDAICRETGLAFKEAVALLLELELEGKVALMRGNQYQRIKIDNQKQW